MCKSFANNRYIVHIFDLSGFGYSDGKRLNQKLEQNLSDIATIIKKMDKDLPMFLVAHSLGALYSTILLLLNK